MGHYFTLTQNIILINKIIFILKKKINKIYLNLMTTPIDNNTEIISLKRKNDDTFDDDIFLNRRDKIRKIIKELRNETIILIKEQEEEILEKIPSNKINIIKSDLTITFENNNDKLLQKLYEFDDDIFELKNKKIDDLTSNFYLLNEYDKLINQIKNWEVINNIKDEKDRKCLILSYEGKYSGEPIKNPSLENFLKENNIIKFLITEELEKKDYNFTIQVNKPDRVYDRYRFGKEDNPYKSKTEIYITILPKPVSLQDDIEQIKNILHDINSDVSLLKDHFDKDLLNNLNNMEECKSDTINTLNQCITNQ